MITEIPGRTRSSQSLICLGFPARTKNTMVEVYGQLLFGSRFCQSGRQQFASFGDRIDVIAQGERHHVRCQTIDHRAGLFARSAVRLLDRDLLSLFACPILRKLLIEVLIKLPGWVVRSIQQCDSFLAESRRYPYDRQSQDESHQKALFHICFLQGIRN